jgi:hypothetical protein
MIPTDTRVYVNTVDGNVYAGKLTHNYSGEGSVSIRRTTQRNGNVTVFPADRIAFVESNN